MAENTTFTRLAGFQSIIPQFDNVSAVTPKYFTEVVENVTKIAECGDDEKLMILKSRIRGDALTHLINSHDLSTETDYKNFVKKFIAFFEKKTSLATRQQMYSNCRMEPKESIKLYASRVTTTTRKFFGKDIDDNNASVKMLLEQTKLSKFLDGLQPEFKKMVLLKDPQTFDEAVNFAELVEINDQFCNNTPVNNIQNTPSSNETEELRDLLLQHTQITHETIATLSEKIEKINLRSRRDNPSPSYMRNRRQHDASRSRSFERYSHPPQNQTDYQNKRIYQNYQNSYNPFSRSYDRRSNWTPNRGHYSGNTTTRYNNPGSQQYSNTKTVRFSENYRRPHNREHSRSPSPFVRKYSGDTQNRRGFRRNSNTGHLN